ncbi:MAG: AsmA family protein [Betaproteobacteria bacterium]|nr:MAG: AsmA family protein [Betaproteobacteria bacterium]
MKVLKYVLLAVGGVVVLVAAAIAVVFATFDPNKYKSELSRVVKEKTGRTLAIEGKIGLSFFPSIGVAVGKTSLSERNSDKTFARIDVAKVSLALLPLLSEQVVVDRVTLSGLNVDLAQDKSGKTNFSDLAGAGGPSASAKAPEPKSAPQRGAVQLDIAGVEVRASSATWRDEATGNRYKATIDELKTGRIASGVPGKLSLAARVEASQPKANYQVSLSGQYRLNFERQAFALSGMELKVSDATPGSKKPPLSLKGDVEFDASPQAIRFTLAADQLNLDRYLPPPEKAKAAAAGARPAATQPEQPIDLSALKGLNLKGDLKIDQLVASNVKLEKVHLGVKAAGGKVDAEPLTADLYQGKFTGAVNVNANTNRCALKADLPGVALGRLLKDALNHDMLEGKGNVALDVQTSGNTVSALKKALAGNARLSMKDGALKGINLEDVIRRLKRQSAAPVAQRTDLSELTASFVIKNGVAHNDDLSAKAPLLRLSGAGDVNIGANVIDYLAKVSVVASSTGQGGKDLADLNGKTLPVKIDGALDAPKFHPDFNALVRNVVKEQAGKAEEKLEERGRDFLKGLIKR